MEDFEFEIFADKPNTTAGGYDEIMGLIKDRVADGATTFDQAVNLILDIARPGNSDNSHDVRPIFVGAMWAFGCGNLTDKFESVYVNTMPWGLGFIIAVEKSLRFQILTKGEQEAIIRSLCITLQAGHLNAAVVDGRIVITDDEGDETVVDVDDIVSQFRTELDEELGPDGPRRWL